MLHGASLTEPAVAAYPSFAPYSLSNLSTSGSLGDSSVVNGHPTTANGFSPATSAAVAALTAAAAAPNIKDSRWLTLEVCRRYQRNQCLRDENECKFAHPPTHVDVQDGRVVCCYDSIKGKCQRRDPPCKYLHPPQHLREQLMRNGRNNMIIRNMQLQLFQQQLLAQTGGILPFAAAAAAAVCTPPVTNPSPVTGAHGPNSLLYPAPTPLALGSPSVSTAYPFLNLGFPSYLNALTSSRMNGTGPSPPSQLGAVNGSDAASNETNSTSTKRSGEMKNGLPPYLSRTNGAHTNGKVDNPDTSANCLMVVNGGSVDSLKETGSNGSPVTLRTTSGNGLINATAAATLYALHQSHNAAMLNVPGAPHQHHPMAGPLSAVSLAAVVNGSSVNASPFSPIPDPTGYFQPAYHIEIPPYPYH